MSTRNIYRYLFGEQKYCSHLFPPEDIRDNKKDTQCIKCGVTLSEIIKLKTKRHEKHFSYKGRI